MEAAEEVFLDPSFHMYNLELGILSRLSVPGKNESSLEQTEGESASER